VLPWMDRTIARQPAVQLSFLDRFVVPTYELLCALFPGIARTPVHLQENRRLWADQLGPGDVIFTCPGQRK
jgi:hypothetical protein